MLGTTLAENPAAWESVPPELLALDAQLRRVLVDAETGLPLLGREEDGEFLLGFAQPTLLCASRQNRSCRPWAVCPCVLLRGCCPLATSRECPPPP